MLADTTQQTETPDWPSHLKNDDAAGYLQLCHGLPITPKTLRNRRSAGTGPKCRYFGTIPIYDRSVLDHWATTEALTDESPVTRMRRRAKTARALAAAAAAE